MTYVKKSHCKRGHKFTPSNTLIIVVKDGYIQRRCRLCRSLKDKERYDSNRHDYRTKAIERGKARYRRLKLSPQFDDQTSPQAPPAHYPR